jgi:hypothetical protein
MRLSVGLLCLLPVGLAAFSDGGGGSISGTILDWKGTPISGATVEVRNPQGRSVYSATSNGSGQYLVPQVPAGSYAITVNIKGLKPYSHAYLSVDKSSAIREDVTLELDENRDTPLPDDPIPARTRKRSKDFYADDAEMELNGFTLRLDGKEVQLGWDLSAIKGNVIWIYVPRFGRYLISLRPHPELGLSLAGQVSGASLWFQLQGQDIQIDADDRIAPGSATYNLYASHQADWLPQESPASTPLLGSNSTRDASSSAE